MGLGLVLRVMAAEPKAERPKIREFPVETLARLGREIYRHDKLAWQATDVLLAQHSPEELQKEGAHGWIVDLTADDAPFVRFVRQHDGNMEAAYDVVFHKDGKPELVEPKERQLTAEQKLHLIARDTALKAMTEGKYPWCGGNPNFVVLSDPDGSGFLVYILRPKVAMDEVPIGGHYRITVAADARHVEQVDRLSASCLTQQRKGPKGETIVALTMSHVVSATPVETHVFLSLQEQMPFYVSTAADKIWKVEDGRISPLENK